jgi:accessory gene regulator protein AgrB
VHRDSRHTVYAKSMNESHSRSIGRTILAVLVLVVAGWLLLHLLAGVVVWLATVAVIVLGVIAVIWALRILL